MNLKDFAELIESKEQKFKADPEKMLSLYHKFVRKVLVKIGYPIESELNQNVILSIEKADFEANFLDTRVRHCMLVNTSESPVFYNSLSVDKNIFSIENSKYLYHTVFLISNNGSFEATDNKESIGIALTIGIQEKNNSFYIDFNSGMEHPINQDSEFDSAADSFINHVKNVIDTYSVSDYYKAVNLGYVEYRRE